MKEPTESEVKKFWEWCGCKVIIFPLFLNPDKIVNDIVFSDKREHRYYELIDSIDLNNLFRYAVPKLDDQQYVFEIYRYYTDAYMWDNEERPAEKGYGVRVYKYGHSKESEAVINSDPALALFWAIYQVAFGVRDP